MTHAYVNRDRFICYVEITLLIHKQIYDFVCLTKVAFHSISMYGLHRHTRVNMMYNSFRHNTFKINIID